MVIGSIIYFKDIKSSAGKSLFLFSITTTLWMLSIYLGYYFVNPDSSELSTFFIRIAFLFGLFMTFSLVSFSYFYPKKSIEYPAWVTLSFLGATVFTSLLSTFTPLIYEAEVIIDGILAEDIHGPFHSLYLFHYLFNCFIATWISLRKIQNSRGIEKNKTIISLVGILSVVLPIIIFHTTLPKFGIYLLQTEVTMFSLVFVGLMFYSMHKYRFLHISNFYLGFIRLFVLIAIFIAATAALHYLFLFGFPTIIEPFIFLFESLPALAITYFASRKIPVFLTEELRVFQKALQNFSYDLYACHSYGELKVLLDEIFKVQLNIVAVDLYLVSKRDITIDVPVYYYDTFTQELMRRKDVLITTELAKHSDNKSRNLLRKMNKLNAELCLPLMRDKELIGFLTLGRKGNDMPYSPEEIQTFKNIQQNLVVSFTNILLKSHWQRELDSLQRVIELKTKKLQDRTFKLKEFSHKQADFIAVAAHEFRTPLTIALLQIQEILQEKSLSARLRHTIDDVHQALERLRDLTESLFSTEQFDLNKVTLNRKDVPILAYCQQIFEEFHAEIQTSGCASKVISSLKKDVICSIDTVRFRQVLHNLIGNAQKHTHAGDSIHCRVERHGKRVRICIDDSGPGISDSKKEQLFSKFGTTNPNASTGIGLGLYLARKITELHDGHIWMEDSSLGGLSICIELPCQ